MLEHRATFPFLFLVALLAGALATAEAAAAAELAQPRSGEHELDNGDCLGCHEDEELDPETDRGEQLAST